MYKYFNLLNNKVTPVICEKVLHCFGHGKKKRVCGSTQVFPCTQNSTLLHEAQPSWPRSNNTFASAAPLGEHTKAISDWTIGVYRQSWVPSHPGATLHSCHVSTVWITQQVNKEHESAYTHPCTSFRLTVLYTSFSGSCTCFGLSVLFYDCAVLNMFDWMLEIMVLVFREC